MTDTKYQALVVDDEAALRQLVTMALCRQGFSCETAADGNEAEARLAEQPFDVVVTDLRMPHKHGHALATSLLQQEDHPIIVVHTGVIEPRLAKDLLSRGVDDILFKPVDFGFLAAKVKALVDRRRALVSQGDADKSQVTELDDELLEVDAADAPVTITRLGQRLTGLSRLLPISQAAIDVYNMTSEDRWEIPQIAAAMQRDPSLVTEVLRLANSAFYNSSGARIVDVEQAIIRIGQKRVGELALATNALSALTPGILPWLDVELAWKRSMAAGIALESMNEEGGHQGVQNGLLLSAIMHPLGRVVLGTLFPKHYESAIGRCRQQGCTLQEQERRLFPLAHTEAMAHVLTTWNIPTEVALPLKYSADDYASLERLSEPVRTRSELVKLAIFIGRLAVGRWESWDLVQFPSSRVLRRLGINDLNEVVDATRSDLDKLADFRPDGVQQQKAAKPTAPQRAVAYYDLSSGDEDPIRALLPALGFAATDHSEEDFGTVAGPVLVNCLGTDAARFLEQHRKSSDLVVITSPDRRDLYSPLTEVITVPDSFARIQRTIQDAAVANPAATETTGTGELVNS